LIYLSILRECFDLEYSELKTQMKIEYNLEAITRDFVFLFFFVGNDFLPRIYAYNIREKSIEKLIQGFKNFLRVTDSYVTGKEQLSLQALLLLLTEVGRF
jgi:5'-3' exonuclease